MTRHSQKPGPILGERDWIKGLRNRAEVSPGTALNRRALRLGIGDDCAILQVPAGHQILVTTDLSLETVHFRREWHTPESAGHRCLARGLSDIAAMGGDPSAAFLSLALPIELTRSKPGKPSWRDRFLTGLLALAQRHHISLAGGDTARSPQSTSPDTTRGLALADIVLIGSAPKNRAIRRSGAQAGDRIYVTGQLGGAAAELAQLAVHPRRFRDCTKSVNGSPNPHPHLFPEPRLTSGTWLRKNRRATAALDISDGLSTDLDHLCEESGVMAIIEASRLPMHPLTGKLSSAESLRLALHGGEDYELLFTASPRMKIPRRISGVPTAWIGEIVQAEPGKPRVILREGGSERPLLPGGWEH
ncbi:MAG TPA: thiamine-phosphate kinase [Acidobacteriaceae bacterium]|nr:thiamine-phosphate kinase [Acidobacteriaceae bacterium]